MKLRKTNLTNSKNSHKKFKEIINIKIINIKVNITIKEESKHGNIEEKPNWNIGKMQMKWKCL